jgi:hypothetical protein
MAMHNKYLVEMQLEDVMRENQRVCKVDMLSDKMK